MESTLTLPTKVGRMRNRKGRTPRTIQQASCSISQVRYAAPGAGRGVSALLFSVDFFPNKISTEFRPLPIIRRAGGAAFVSPALQRGESRFDNYSPESRRDGAIAKPEMLYTEAASFKSTRPPGRGGLRQNSTGPHLLWFCRGTFLMQESIAPAGRSRMRAAGFL